MTSYKEKLNHVNTFIFDVDGVLTNGDVTILQDQYVRTLNSRDGYALQYATKMGFKIFVITGGSSQVVKEHLLGMGIIEVFLSSFNKLNVYNEIKEQYNITDEEIAYMGDDIPDYQVMKIVGVATCPQDAAVEIKSISHYQSPFDGGRHCVRDIIEQTMRVQGKWFSDEAFEW